MADRSWEWVDAVTGERGHAVVELDGLEPGDEMVVELQWKGGWRATRFIAIPDRLLRRQLEELRIGSAVEEPDAPVELSAERWTPPAPGEVRAAPHDMDPRSTADRDAGRLAKRRPAIVVWVDEVAQQAGIRFVFGTGSAVLREGRGRKLRGWREAGLRKPSVVAHDESLRAFEDLGPCLGEVTAGDRGWLLPDRPPGQRQ